MEVASSRSGSETIIIGRLSSRDQWHSFRRLEDVPTAPLHAVQS